MIRRTRWIFSRSRLFEISSGVSNSTLVPTRNSEGPLRTNFPPFRRASRHTLHKQPTRGVVSAPPVPRKRNSSRLVSLPVLKTYHRLVVERGKGFRQATGRTLFDAVEVAA